MRIPLIALAVCTLASCEHKSAEPRPQSISPTAPSPIVQCPVPTYDWDLERFADSHSVTIRTTGERPALIVIAGQGVVRYGVKKQLPAFGRYVVTGTNSCGATSVPHVFDVVPNPNASGELPAPAVPTCTDPRATRPGCDW